MRREEEAEKGGKAGSESPSKGPLVRLGEHSPGCPEQACLPHLEALGLSGQSHLGRRPTLLEISHQASSLGFDTSPFWSCLSPNLES